MNAITIYLAQDPTTSQIPLPKSLSHTTTCELVLDANELWVHITFENHAVEKFFIQRFNEGIDLEGSRLYQFVKELARDPTEGVKRAQLARKWESTSKHINRLKLPEPLKQKFFGKSYSSRFEFKGTKVFLKSEPSEMRLILNELRMNQLKVKIVN